MTQFERAPIEVQEKMLERQVEQGNHRDPNVFIRNFSAGKANRGFNWSDTPEGHDFWENIVDNGDYSEFFELYPKHPIKPEFQSLYKKTFRVNRIIKVDTEEVKKRGLEHVLQNFV